MKFGILCLGYDCDEHISEVLAPWVQAKSEFDMVFSCVSCQFKEYAELFGPVNKYFPDHGIFNFYDVCLSHPQDHEARNLALDPLLESGCDFIWILDLQDEIYTIEQIRNIVAYVQADKDNAWWRLHFKNYVFDGKGWVDFAPPRIYRNYHFQNKECYEIFWFKWENDAQYISWVSGSFPFDFGRIKNATIPESVAHIKHLTWLNNERSRRKVLYQLKFLGCCSYAWDEQNNCLKFDLDYYKDKPLPVIRYD